MLVLFLFLKFRAILICCGGFGDNGRMFQEYGAYFEDRMVQLLSFTFPGLCMHHSVVFVCIILLSVFCGVFFMCAVHVYRKIAPSS